MMNNEKEKDAIDTSKLDEILPKYDPLKLNSINLAQNYVSAFNTGMNIYQCVNQLQGYIEWVVKAVNDVVKLWNVQVGESIDQSKAIVRETTTEQFNTEWTNKQPELIEQVNTLTTNQFNKDWIVLENRIDTTLENQNNKINSIQKQQTNLSNEQTNLSNEQTTLSNRMDTFTKLPEGSTTGDAELRDIRVGANGITYDTAGNAVRGQYDQLKLNINAINSGIAQSIIFSSFGFYKSGNQKKNLGSPCELLNSYYYNQGESGSGRIQALFGSLLNAMQFSETKTLYLLINSSISKGITVHLGEFSDWSPGSKPLIGYIEIIKGCNIYRVDLVKQYSDDYYEHASEFNYLMFEIDNNDVPFENLIFDVYAFDNSFLYDFIQSERKKTGFDYEIIYWGDSLTAGAGGSGVTYPSVCSNELGITNYINAGVGGESANTIACRNGSNSMIIPVGNVNGTYSIGDFKDQYGVNISPLRQGNGGNTINPIKVNGHECTLSISQASITDPNATYTISGYNGEPIKYPMSCKFSGCDLTSKITVIFVGQNGPSFEQRLSIIDSMISRTNGNFVVLTLSSGTEEERKEEEDKMLLKYGNHLFNTREMLSKYGMELMNLTPSEQDTLAINSGSVPPSLRSDQVHLNASGYTALGKMLASHIRALGYVD